MKLESDFLSRLPSGVSKLVDASVRILAVIWSRDRDKPGERCIDATLMSPKIEFRRPIYGSAQ